MEVVYSLPEMQDTAAKLISCAAGGTVLAFEGEMGAGKTTLIQVVCRLLGVTGPMGSPTFSIINEYAGTDRVIYHIDLYRCNSEEEAVRAGVEECLYSGNLCLVEWPSRAKGIFPDDTIWLSVAEIGDGRRKIIVNCKK